MRQPYNLIGCVLERWTLDVGRWTLDVGRSLLIYGRNSRQTPRTDSSRTRLGLFERSAKSLRETGRWRRDFAEGWPRPAHWKRDLQFEIANRSAPLFQTAAGP